jgi:hypothetical protein
MPRPLSTPRKDPVPIVQEAGWVLGPVWTCAKNLAPTGIRSPGLPYIYIYMYVYVRTYTRVFTEN